MPASFTAQTEDYAMNDSQTFTTGLQLILSGLQAIDMQNSTPTQLEKHEPFQLSVNLTFKDTVNGNLVNLLLPLGLAIRVTFTARPFSEPGSEMDLGHITLITAADQLTYTPRLRIEGGAESVGLNPNTVYQIKAIAKVGHAPFSMPTLARGYINGLELPVSLIEAKEQPVKSRSEIKTEEHKVEENKADKPQTPSRSRASRSRATKA